MGEKVKINSEKITHYNQNNRQIKHTIFTYTLVWISVLGFVVQIFFIRFRFSDFPWRTFFNDTFSTYLYMLSIIIYFFSWLWGVTFDIKDQKKVVVKNPYEGRYPKHAIIMFVILAALFIALILSPSFKIFSILLLLLVFINMLSWRFVLLPIAKQTLGLNIIELKKTHNTHGLHLLNCIRTHIFGVWQWYRFYVGLLIIIIIILSYYTSLTEIISSLIKIKSTNIIISSLIFVYVVIIEGWIWFIRIRRTLQMRTIENLNSDHPFISQSTICQYNSVATRKTNKKEKKLSIDYSLLIISIFTFFAGFFSFLVLSIVFNVFWIDSTYQLPLIYNWSVMIGDSILIPIINYMIFYTLFVLISIPVIFKYKSVLTIYIVISLFISVISNTIAHLAWLNDGISDFISLNLDKFSIIGWWHFVFSIIEMFILLFVGFLWYVAIKEKKLYAIKYIKNTWLIIFVFTLLATLDLLTKYFVVFNGITIQRMISMDKFAFITPSLAILIFIIFKIFEVRQSKKRNY